MIIASCRELQVGKIYNQDKVWNETNSSAFLTLKDDHHFEYTFYVIRVATYEEYKQGIINEYPDYAEKHRIANPDLYSYFYEISMD